MRRHTTTTVMFGHHFSDDLLNPAFVTGVIGLIVLAIMLFTETSGYYKIAGWVLAVDLIGLSVTLCWGALALAPQSTSNSDEGDSPDLEI